MEPCAHLSICTHGLCAPGGLQQELLERYGKLAAVLMTQGLASSPPGFPKGRRRFITPVAGLLEESLASVLLQQISRQAVKPAGLRPQATWGEEKLESVGS